MLNQESAYFVCGEAYRLINSPRFQVSRALRRFLQQVVEGQFFIQSFAYDEGYNETQLKALEVYAQRKDEEAQPRIAHLGFERVGTTTDNMFGLVSNIYKLPFQLQEASLKQLQSALHLVRELAETLAEFRAGTPAVEAGFEDYALRNLPCNISSDEKLWMVGGHDKRTGASGVLEWCFDEEDAKSVLAEMTRFPERFIDIKAEPYCAGTGMHWAVAQAFGDAQPA